MSDILRSRVGVFEELLIFVGLFVVQVIYGVYIVFLNRILALGIDQLFLITFGGFATAVILLPFAVIFERNHWPTKLSPSLIGQLFLLALGGMTLFQVLMLLGIQKTSPAVASAMPNLAPGIIFIIAACARFENFKLQCWYSRAKVLGTLVCLTGAVAMSFLQSPTTSPRITNNSMMILSKALGETVDNEWILGCMYLFAAVVILSCYTVLQATTLRSFPAPLSMTVITVLLGSLLTTILQIIIEGKVNAGAPTVSFGIIATIVLVSGAVVGICVAYQAWCIGKKGPVFVAIFSPIQTVSTLVLSAIVLKQIISFGSLAGMILMFGGLYIFLWAKNNEDLDTGFDVNPDTAQPIEDVEKPLLH